MGHKYIGMEGMELPAIPRNLKESIDSIQIHLHNIAPITENGIDGFWWDPTDSSYLIHVGHHFLCSKDYLAPPWMYWKTIWKSEAIPKVKFFIWTLLKGKILTSKICKIKVLVGPLDAQIIKGKKKLSNIYSFHAPLQSLVGMVSPLLALSLGTLSIPLVKS